MAELELEIFGGQALATTLTSEAMSSLVNRVQAKPIQSALLNVLAAYV